MRTRYECDVSESGDSIEGSLFRVRLCPERHGLLIRARDSCVRIPVQIFTVALFGLRGGAGAPPFGQRERRLLAQSLDVCSQFLCVCLADTFVTKGVRCFLLRTAVFDEIGQLGIRSLLNFVG